jgi:hypothetical protein
VPAYINTGPDPADLPETRDGDGKIHPAVTVPPGGRISWPYPIAGFAPAPATKPSAAKSAPEPAAKQAAGGEAK